MLAKIISGGQTGADRAALDVAIEFSVPHGGSVPKGRKAEDGPVPDRYLLKEMRSSDYRKRTEQNVLDSHGTLILSHGKLTGGSKVTLDMAVKHNRPCLHVDLNYVNGFAAAAQQITGWITENQIRMLNVAGSRASKDPQIYDATFKVLKTVLLLGMVSEGLARHGRASGHPRSVEEAVNTLASLLNLKDKARIARLDEKDLEALHDNLKGFIRTRFGLWSGNQNLIDSCRVVSGNVDLSEEECSRLIVQELWKSLTKTHSIRAVK